MPPNVILVVFDTARADVLEPYGAPANSSPALAHLASTGWAAPACYATSNWTLPSHLSLFTGLLPRPAGLGPQVPPRWVVKANAERSLPTVLRARGYATAGISANPWISDGHGFADGFDRFVRVQQTRKHAPQGDLKSRTKWLLRAVRARIDDGISEIDRTFDSWIDERSRGGNAAEPFFWFANLMECHSPYLPPRPYNDLGLVGRIRAARDAARIQSHDGFVAATLGSMKVSDSSLDRMRYLYRRAIRSMDDWLGRLIERLDAAGLLDDTVIAVVSDHGENLGECGLYSHMLSLDDRLIHVPFVVGGGGATFAAPDGPTSLADVARVLADGIGLADHPWAERQLPSGVAAAQYDGMASFAPEFADKLVAGLGLSPQDRQTLSRSGECVTDGRFKLVRSDGAEALYDVTSDPLETTDVGAGHPDVLERLRAALRDVTERPAKTISEPRDAAPDQQELSDLEERMRVLGYL